jgi:hypothetical protein
LEYQLRLTARAAEDLGLSPDDAGLPAEALVDEHPVIRAFVERRGQSPVSPEATYPPVTRIPVYNLHHERWRGLTWHDKDHGVVWLLGVEHHETGSRDDVYAVLKDRDIAEQLFPDETDYRRLNPDARSFASELRRYAADLIERASESGEWESALIDDVLEVGFRIEVIEHEGEDIGAEHTLRIQMPPLTGGVLPDEWQASVLAAFFPAAELHDIRALGFTPDRAFEYQWDCVW